MIFVRMTANIYIVRLGLFISIVNVECLLFPATVPPTSIKTDEFCVEDVDIAEAWKW